MGYDQLAVTSTDSAAVIEKYKDMEGIKKLLSEVGKIRARVESYNQASGRFFNIFSIANIATDEVKTFSINSFRNTAC